MTKSRTGSSGKKGGAMVLAIAVDQARRALEDPETRQKIAEQGRAMASYVKTWNEGRSERSADDDRAPRRGVTDRITDQFGQGKLERRLANLRGSLAALSDGRPELATSLAPFAASVDQVAVSLEIAGSLPLVKRTSAQRRIDQALDQLELSLFEASLPGGTE